MAPVLSIQGFPSCQRLDTILRQAINAENGESWVRVSISRHERGILDVALPGAEVTALAGEKTGVRTIVRRPRFLPPQASDGTQQES